MEYQKYAVIDIGSNSLRLMTGWQEVPGTWIFSPKELATTRLGKDIDETHHLSPAGMEASFAAMERWKGQLTGIPVCAVATSAVREAVDGQAFLAEVRARFGWHCRAISGLEEASLSFTGAAPIQRSAQFHLPAGRQVGGPYRVWGKPLDCSNQHGTLPQLRIRSAAPSEREPRVLAPGNDGRLRASPTGSEDFRDTIHPAAFCASFGRLGRGMPVSCVLWGIFFVSMIEIPPSR